MTFAQPLWLAVGLAVCALLVLAFRLSGQARRRTLEKFAASHLLPQLTASMSPQLRLIKQILWVLAVAMLFTALARPQWGFYWEEIKRRGIDILIAVDTSKSMLAQDVKPDRLTRAKLAVNDLVDQIGGDRVGLIAFAGEAFLQCPLTLDHSAFLESLQALDTTIIPRGGTDVASAITEAEAAFVNEGQNHKILVLITDGEDLEGRALDVARDAAKQGVKIYTIGVGSSTGELVPVPDERGGVAFAKDENGNFVKSRLDEKMLRQIADVTGGSYEPLGSDGQGLIKVYNRDLKTLPQYDLSSRQQRVYYERFQWPLGLALALFIIELLLIERRAPAKRRLESRDIRPKHHITVQRHDRKRSAPVAILLSALLLSGLTAQASPGSAEKAYKKGQYGVALQQYSAEEKKHPDRAELQYNVGASAYKAGQWNEAAQAFQKALGAQDPVLVQNTSYNLGNTLYRIGQETEKSNPQQTIGAWEQAIQAYEGALRIKADDADAKYNRDYVKKKLEELKKQQPPQQQKNDQQQDQQQKQDQKNQDKNQQNQNQSDKDKNQNPENKDKNQDKNNQSNSSNSQNQNQGGKPDEKKDQNQNKDQAGQNGQKPEEKKQPAQPENKPGQQPDQKPQQAKQGEDGGEEPRPGQMSKAEARNLLDSAKGDEKKVMLLQGKQNEKADQREVKKDW